MADVPGDCGCFQCRAPHRLPSTGAETDAGLVEILPAAMPSGNQLIEEVLSVFAVASLDGAQELAAQEVRAVKSTEP